MKLGEKLKILRLEKGLSLQELADKFNVGKTTIANYERGDRKPDYEMIIKFCKFFDVTSDYLLGLTDDPNLVVVKGEDLPKELRDIGVDYLHVTREMIEKGWSPEKIKKIIEAFDSVDEGK